LGIVHSFWGGFPTEWLGKSMQARRATRHVVSACFHSKPHQSWFFHWEVGFTQHESMVGWVGVLMFGGYWWFGDM